MPSSTSKGNGINWRALPHDFPPWQTGYDYYRRWVRTGLWEQINQTLAQQVRQAQGRELQPSLILMIGLILRSLTNNCRSWASP